jgi:leucyl-tRNA synthetase
VEVGRTEKMSKSKKNVVDPDDLLADYGADTIRLFSLFAAPPEKDLEWSDDGVQGSFRFLQRVWRLAEERAPLLRAAQGAPWPDGDLDDEVRALRRATHQTITRVTRDLEDSFHLNTALAALMELQNTLTRFQERVPATPGSDPRLLAFAEGVRVLLTLLAPFAPHMAEELWEMLGQGASIFRESWPTADPALALEERVEVVVQVNGKVRARLLVARGHAEEPLKALALAEPRVQPWIEGRPVRKVVVIPDRLVNIVVAG